MPRRAAHRLRSTASVVVRRAWSYDPSVPAKRHGADRLAGCERREQLTADTRVAGQRECAGGEHRAREERRRRDRASQLVQDDGEVGVAAAGSAVLLGDVERGPAQLDHLVPERAVVAGRLGQRARTCSGDDARPSSALAVARSSSRSSIERGIRGSYRGRPSMRSPITFRWISFVPPPMSQPNEWM